MYGKRQAPTRVCSWVTALTAGASGMPQIVDVRAIRLEPVRVSIAELALLQWPTLAIGLSGDHGCVDAAAADGALCRVSARDN